MRPLVSKCEYGGCLEFFQVRTRFRQHGYFFVSSTWVRHVHSQRLRAIVNLQGRTLGTFLYALSFPAEKRCLGNHSPVIASIIHWTLYLAIGASGTRGPLPGPEHNAAGRAQRPAPSRHRGVHHTEGYYFPSIPKEISKNAFAKNFRPSFWFGFLCHVFIPISI